MARLDGKIALITGAAVGMGATHARVFVEEGAKVIIADVNEEGGQQLADELGDAALYLRHDVTDPGSWAAVVAMATDAFGHPSVLVNNAGVAGPIAPTADISDEDYLRTVSVDQHGVLFGMRAVIPGMIKAGGGAVVNISSIAGNTYVYGCPNPAYTAAKFAVRGLTRAAAVEYAAQNIRVNSVHPGGVATPLMLATIDEATMTALASAVPLGRLAYAREVSAAVLFLASDEASYITGTEIIVDGGQLATSAGYSLAGPRMRAPSS